MSSNHEPEALGKTGATTNRALKWTYVLDDPALMEGSIAPAYPLGVNVLLARVGGTVYAVSGKCAHMACPLLAGRLEEYTIVCHAMTGVSTFERAGSSMRRSLVSLCTPQSLRRENCSLTSVQRKRHEKS